MNTKKIYHFKTYQNKEIGLQEQVQKKKFDLTPFASELNCFATTQNSQ